MCPAPFPPCHIIYHISPISPPHTLMKFCTNCGTATEPSQKFCGECGSKCAGGGVAKLKQDQAHATRMQCELPSCSEAAKRKCAACKSLGYF